jgi:hypothetical protein
MNNKCKHTHGPCNKPKPFYLAPLSMQCDNKYCINKFFNSLLTIQYYYSDWYYLLNEEISNILLNIRFSIIDEYLHS